MRKKRLQSSADRREFIKDHIKENKKNKKREKEKRKKMLCDAYDRAMNVDGI